MTKQTPTVPAGLYSDRHDGLTDPDRFTAGQRRTTAPERAAFELGRRRSVSPFVRALQAATDRAMGRTR